MAKITNKTKCAIEIHVLSAFLSKMNNNELLFAYLTSLFVSIIRTLLRLRYTLRGVSHKMEAKWKWCVQFNLLTLHVDV